MRKHFGLSAAAAALALTLPLLAPSLLPGIALVYLLGNQGLLKDLFGGATIYGFWGIVAGEAFYTFPHALMILLTGLTLADGRLYDAARAMGAGPWRTFLTVTLPGTRYAVFSACCVVFTLTVTDFGVPKVVGGDYNVLAMEAYKAVVGQQNFPKGAAIGILLLLPAVLTFALDRRLREQTQFELVNIQEQVGITFVIVTHDQEEAMTMSSRIAVMNSGA